MLRITGVRRAIALSIGLATIASAMGWWGRESADGRIGAAAALHAPAGSEVVLSLLTVLSVGPGDRYVVGNATLAISVVGPARGLAVGDEVTVGGVVRDGGGVAAAWVTPAPGRAAKKRLGLVGLAVAAALGAAAVRVERGGLAIRGLGYPGAWPIS